MAGTKAGGARAAATNKAKYGEDYYTKIGSIGGSTPKETPSGWAYMKIHNPERISELGRIGGRISRRTAKV